MTEPKKIRSNAGETDRRAAVDEAERPQTVAQREAEHMAKYRKSNWAARPSAEGDEAPRASDEREREHLGRYEAPAWAKGDAGVAGVASNQVQKKDTSEPPADWKESIRRWALSNSDMTDTEREAYKEKMTGRIAKVRSDTNEAIMPAVMWSAQNVPGMMPALQRDIQHNKDRAEARRLLAEQAQRDFDAAGRRARGEPEPVPTDGGELDEPRPPIQMQREFSNEKEKEAYLERLKQAMANSKKDTASSSDGAKSSPAPRRRSPEELMDAAKRMEAQTAAQPRGSSLQERDSSGGIMPEWLTRDTKENGYGKK